MCKKIEGSCQAPVDNNLVEYICEEGFDIGKDLARKFAHFPIWLSDQSYLFELWK